MPHSAPAFLLLAVFLFFHAHAARGQDAAATTLRDLLRKTENIRQLMQTLPADDPRREKYAAQVNEFQNRLAAEAKPLQAIADDILNNYRATFADLHTHEKLSWRVAVRHKEFLEEHPRVMTFRREANELVIRKSGNEGNVSSYHVCPAVPLADGDRVAIRYMVLNSGAGGTPVPYFGIRDEKGTEQVLCLFGSEADERMQELLVQRIGDEGFALRTGTPGQRVGPDKKLTSPMYLFFHMSDTAELLIHSIKFSRKEE